MPVRTSERLDGLITAAKDNINWAERSGVYGVGNTMTALVEELLAYREKLRKVKELALLGGSLEDILAEVADVE